MSLETDQEEDLREKELAFFGAVTASISHDLNNSIAIIEQTAGLLEDLIMGSEGERPIPNEQLQKIADRIAKQTKRGATIVRRLNAFAHSVDEDIKDLELNALIQTVGAVAYKLAERKRVMLETRLTTEPIKIKGNAFRIQQAVFLSLQRAVSVTPETEKVLLSTGTKASSAFVSVESRVSEGAPAANETYLEVLMDQIGGTVEETTSESSHSILLAFPT